MPNSVKTLYSQAMSFVPLQRRGESTFSLLHLGGRWKYENVPYSPRLRRLLHRGYPQAHPFLLITLYRAALVDHKGGVMHRVDLARAADEALWALPDDVREETLARAGVARAHD